MKKAIICHGCSPTKDYQLQQDLPSCAKNWLPWLQQKFLMGGVVCQTPAFPNTWIPDRDYNTDSEILSQFNIDNDTSLIGYSLGAGLLLNYLSEHPEIKVKHLVLVAPGLDIDGKVVKNYKTNLDPKLFERVGKIDLLYSENDSNIITQSIKLILETYPNINLHNCGPMGHFQESDMKTKEFPKLWEVCKSEI